MYYKQKLDQPTDTRRIRVARDKNWQNAGNWNEKKKSEEELAWIFWSNESEK